MSQQAETTKGSTAAPGAPEAEPLAALSDLERGLQGLKRLYEERKLIETKLAEVQSRLMDRETELSTREHELAETRTAFEQKENEIAALREQVRVNHEEARQATADLATLRSEFEARAKDQAEAEAARKAESDKSKTLAAELDAFATELQTLQADLEREKQDLQSQRSAVLAGADKIKARETELAALEQREAAIAAREAELVQQSARLDEQRKNIEAQGERSDQETQGRLRAACEEAEQLRSDLERVARRCAAQEEVLAEYEQLLAVERSHVHTLTESICSSDSDPQQLKADLAELKRCLANEREIRAKLERQATQPVNVRQPGAPAPVSALRLKRLKRCRAILREQVGKVRKASEVLARRFEQCEQVLAQRAQLAAVKRQLDVGAATLARRQAGRKAGVLVLSVVTTLAILGALSWAVVGQVMPGTFAARAELVADGRGRELSDAEFDEWKHSLEASLAEPQFIDLVADRMKRRGYESLGTAVAVRALFADALAHESPSPGTLNLELRLPGAERATRSLDIIATTLASEANAARERRADGAVTLIKTAAVAGERPVEDQRLLHSAILLACSTVVTFGLGGLAWRSLSKAKHDFEFGTQIDGVLDEAKWAEFTAATTTQRP
ncbi:MAG: hypothetical protein U0573_05080 [Phycisphaerales bacterium]|nr:hypothetical protein [Planctomycetota bacterium]